MAAYEVLGRFYDSVMGNQVESAKQVHRLIKENSTKVASLLELACGTGSLLSYLSRYYEVSGLDLSSTMLSIARNKLPDVPLYQSDMAKFRYDRSFDAIICMNDSVNHLLTFPEWKSLFSNVHKHLNDEGIFIFDINTEFKLMNLSLFSPIVHEFDDNFLITDVAKARSNIYEWNLRVFEHIRDNHYKLYEETLFEKSFKLNRIKNALSEKFKVIHILDLDKTEVTAQSERLHFVAIKR